jgi:hypothetical protein
MLVGINSRSNKRFVLVDVGRRGIQELIEIKQYVGVKSITQLMFNKMLYSRSKRLNVSAGSGHHQVFCHSTLLRLFYIIVCRRV